MKNKIIWKWVSIVSTCVIVILTNSWFNVRGDIIPNILWIGLLIVAILLSSISLYKLVSINKKNSQTLKPEQNKLSNIRSFWLVLVIILPAIVVSLPSKWFASIFTPIDGRSLTYIVVCTIALWLWSIYKVYLIDRLQN